MLGVPVRFARHAALLLATLCTSAVISRTGLISFVGLLAPHGARLLDREGKSGLGMAALAGAVLMLFADVLARMLAASELPVSIVTSLLGAPVLFVLFCRKDGKSHE